MTETSFSMKRLCKMVLLLLVTIFVPACCGLLKNTRLDDMIVWAFVSIVYVVCFCLYLEHERLHDGLSRGISNDYSMIVFIYIICLLAACVSIFLPAYTAPVMAISVLSNGIFKNRLGSSMAIYFSLLPAIYLERELYMVVCYVLLAVVGMFLVDLYVQKELQLWTAILICSVSLVIPVCCQYFMIHTVSLVTVLVTLVCSGITLATFRILPRLCEQEVQAETVSLDTIMNESYHLRKEIMRYSTVDYEHAIRTSNVAAHLAASIGADEKLACAGGFYYRIGKLEGEPFVENGVRIAQHNCFSERLVSILQEYNGEHQLPSTIESAIVQIADMIVTKFDLLDKETFSSSWNRDIVIYQSMNEKSAEGLYDNSGLSMNQFLTIRETLVKEELLV